jgi:prepilin-type N-terminal cleavage/methylation domain-containing protein/prepilin-type processing-associated H-X9-DG protein
MPVLTRSYQRRHDPRPPARGFTAIELSVSILIIVIIIAIALPAMQPRRHGGSRQLKDSTQVRGIVQAMVIWAQNNNGKYPLPSEIDAQGFTLPGEAHTKDTTGHVLSLLIYNGNISTDLCISPAESNTGQAVRSDDYEFTNPKAAVKPEDAIWDPRFRGTPLDAPIGDRAADSPANNSYAQLVNLGARREKWKDTFATTEAVFGNRGPAYAAEDSAPHPQSGKWKLLDGPLGRDSNTLLIHGGRTTWEGNIAYNDGHVSFETRPAPDGVAYSRGGDPKKLNTPDNLFVNESDETDGDTAPGSFDKGRNAYLRPIAGYTAPGKPILWRD